MDVSADPSVSIISSDDKQADVWNDYVDRAETASFYHRFEWKQINETSLRHKTYYLASERSGRIDGIFPLVLIQSRLFGRILCSLPFVNYCGPSAPDPTVERALLEQAYAVAKREKVDFLEIRGLRQHDDELPDSQNKVSMTVKLDGDPDVLWSGFQSKHRTAIRRVYKSGISVRSGHKDLLDAFYNIMAQSWRSLGTPIYQKQYYQSILEAFGDKVRIFIAYKDDTPIATAFNGHHRDTVEGMWAGSLPEHRDLHSNYVLYWEMLKQACEDGFSLFHLGRSSVGSGGESFKKKWCADTRQLYWQYYIPGGGDIPRLNVDNPKYALAINVWRKLPLRITQVVGPALARNIP